MIILAATIIISLNNSGIIDNANKAKEDSDLANIKTAADLIYSDYILNKDILPEGMTVEDYITEKLVESGVIRKDEKDYYIVVDKNVTNVVQVGSMVDKYYKGEIKIGDYVSYDAGENSIKLNEYTGESHDNNISSNEVTIKSTSSMKWQVLGAHGNVLELVSEDVVRPEEKTKFSLYGSYSYLKGEEILNNACSIFGKGKGATKSRSITADDINKITGFDKTTSSVKSRGAATDNYWQVSYGTKITYEDGFKMSLPYYYYMDAYMGYKEMKIRTMYQPDIYSTEDNGDGRQYKKKKVMTLTQTAYSYEYNNYKDNVSENALNMLKKSYWLANKVESLSDEYILFSVQYSMSDGVGSRIVYVSGFNGMMRFGKYDIDYDCQQDNALRPVVELEANIFGTKSEDTWTLNK